eukprot:10957458-Heterocapsa_arctica.AAC.1
MQRDCGLPQDRSQLLTWERSGGELLPRGLRGILRAECALASKRWTRRSTALLRSSRRIA